MPKARAATTNVMRIYVKMAPFIDATAELWQLKAINALKSLKTTPDHAPVPSSVRNATKMSHH